MIKPILLLFLFVISTPAQGDSDEVYVCIIHRYFLDRQGKMTQECEGSIDLNRRKKFDQLKKCNAAMELVLEDGNAKVMLFDTYEFADKLRAFRTTVVEFPDNEIPRLFTLRILRETNRELKVSVRILDSKCSKI